MIPLKLDSDGVDSHVQGEFTSTTLNTMGKSRRKSQGRATTGKQNKNYGSKDLTRTHRIPSRYLVTRNGDSKSRP